MIFSGKYYLSLVVALVTVLLPRVAVAALPPVERVETPTPASARHTEVSAEVKRLMEAQDREGLEKLANELRQSRERLDGGTWLLSSYQDAIGKLPEDDAQAKERVEFFERWATEQPENTTAQICFAKVLTSDAWRARGTGWASEVTPEGWEKYRAQLGRAQMVLTGVKDKRGYPDLMEAAQTVALGQGWAKDTYLTMVDNAIGREPTYGRYYTKACYFLLPRWHGERGDFEKWLGEKADSHPPEERDRVYAFLVWMAERMPVRGEIVFGKGRLDWERTKRGFDQWLKEQENLMVRFEYIRLGLLADDRDAVRAQFDVIGAKYWPPMWRSEGEFMNALKYAYEGEVNPLREKSADEERRKPQLDGETLALIGKVGQHGAGFLGGLIAGALLLALAVQRGAGLAGGVALAASIVLGSALGTMATLAPALGLWLYLRSKKNVWPPEIRTPHGGIVLLWVVGLMAMGLMMQIPAAILAALPQILSAGSRAEADNFTEALTIDGTAARIGIAGFWLVLLMLLVICGRLNPEGWRKRLGVYPVSWGKAIGWTIPAAALSAGVGYLLMSFMDEKSLESLRQMALGRHSPVSYYLLIVVMAPLVEELIFRGYAYSGWIGKIGFWPTAGLTSVIFAGAHFQYGWAGLLFVLVLGLVAAGLRRVTGSVYPCIAMHALVNLTSCILTEINPDRF